jgi:DNA-binding GntR family transcriptional regulator
MLNNRISLLRSLSLAQPSRLEKMIEEIDLMMKMIKRRDSEKAAEATLLHIKNAAVNVVLMLEKNKDF